MSDFQWPGTNGIPARLDQMNTVHVFHALRMTWNHSVPAEFQISGARRNLPWITDRNYVCLVLDELHAELMRRDIGEELDEMRLEQFDYIQSNKGQAPFTPDVREED